ncbi:MAG: DDE-type integrase/transposase/recombinase [Candidatus Omnitrophica bacterium]|nr:DDE-type integrase/transposase/recombinase [Candidatus Omnitrophota bacterium]
MKNPSAYLKMKILGAIDYAEGKSIAQRIKTISEQTFIDEDGHPRKFTWRTISTWLYRYKSKGVTGVEPKPRKDKGSTRKFTPEELLEAINIARRHFKDQNTDRMSIYRYCIEKGIINKNELAQTTFYRFIREYDLMKPDDELKNKKRLAFCMQYANQLWQADTMFGPYVKDGTKHKQSKLIAFIDDASRVICHGEFFFEETVDSLVKALKAAFYKRGIPEQLYVDNGSIYCSQEITLICARTGCILRHTPVRDGAAKGKIERFFKRVRSQFLSRRLDLSSLEKLNNQFTAWVEDEYNAVGHSVLGMKPIDRFAFDLKRIRFLEPSDVQDELFFAEETRKVKKDNTFSFKNQRFETPVDLRDKTVIIRFDRSKPDRIIVYYKNQRMGPAKPLDMIANGLLRRKVVRQAHHTEVLS